MKALVLGGSGMLGSDLVAELRNRGHEVIAPAPDELDITDPQSVATIIETPHDWCFNCAGYTAVDKAETEQDEALKLNTLAPGYVARSCAMANIRLMHMGTDFVFDGDTRHPYEEGAKTNPLSVYGQTKRDGEEEVLAAHPNPVIVRTAWLYGPNGRCFPKTMIEAWKAGKTLKVVADQTGSPTYTADLARVLTDIAEKNPEPGIYHAAGRDPMTWYELAQLSLETYRRVHNINQSIDIYPIETEDWPTPAIRPPFSVLRTERLRSLGIAQMRPTASAMEDFCRRLPV